MIKRDSCESRAYRERLPIPLQAPDTSQDEAGTTFTATVAFSLQPPFFEKLIRHIIPYATTNVPIPAISSPSVVV